MLSQPKTRKAASGEEIALGVMRTMHAHTPPAHVRLMSCELLRRTRCQMSGRLKNGKMTLAQYPISFAMDRTLVHAAS